MYKNTENKSDEILRLFNEGKMLTEICELTTSSQPTVKKVLRSLNIDYDALRKADYENRLAQVQVLYQQGKSQLYIEENLRLTRLTIRKILKSNPEIHYKSISEQWRIRWGFSLDETCFNSLSFNACYWIGMLYADGHILKEGKEPGIELTQHTSDINHLEKFRLFLKSDRKITDGHGDCKRVRINSSIIHKRLVDLGFTHNKSYTAVPHPLLKESRDFWRGVVDGDGGVYNGKGTPSIFLCGTLETIFDFIIFNSKFAKVKDKYPSKAYGKELYQVHYYGKDSLKIATLLYEGSETYLDRKYQKYEEIKQRLIETNNKIQQ